MSVGLLLWGRRDRPPRRSATTNDPSSLTWAKKRPTHAPTPPNANTKPKTPPRTRKLDYRSNRPAMTRQMPPRAPATQAGSKRLRNAPPVAPQRTPAPPLHSALVLPGKTPSAKATGSAPRERRRHLGCQHQKWPAQPSQSQESTSAPVRTTKMYGLTWRTSR